MRILSIDPGKTSGVALFKEGKLLETLEADENYLLDYITYFANEIDIVVIEAFVHYPWRKNHAVHSYYTAELIGKIKLKASMHNLKVAIQPALIKKVVSDEVLKHFGFTKYLKKSSHIKDALRHGLYYLKYRKKQ